MNDAMKIRETALRDAARCVIQDPSSAYSEIMAMAEACHKTGPSLCSPMQFDDAPPCLFHEGARVRLNADAMEWRFVERIGLPSASGTVVSSGPHATSVAVLFDGDALPGVRLVACEWLEMADA